MKQWIENQAKALADYASLKYLGHPSEAHDLVRLYTEDCLLEAQDRTIERVLEAADIDIEGMSPTKVKYAIYQAIKGVGDE